MGSVGKKGRVYVKKKMIHTVPTVLVNGYVHSGQTSIQFKRFDDPSSITQFFLSVYKVTNSMFYFCPATAYNTQDTGPDCYEMCLIQRLCQPRNRYTDNIMRFSQKGAKH
jgi:hypothetical protein